MKRIVLSLLMFAACICGAVAQNDAMFVYRNDGQINAFLKTDIDSMRYSHIGLDSLEHHEFVIQEVWTADSVYRIPLAAIDSVSFVTPPTVYKSDVTNIEENLLDYIIGCDSLTLKLNSATPAHLLPHSGDKLVLLDGCEALPYGFSGIVSEVQTVGDGIDVVCEQAYLEDLFDSFCSVSTMYGSEEAPPVYVTSGKPNRIVYNPNDVTFKLPPFTYDANREISEKLNPDSDLAVKYGVEMSVSVQPTFRIHTFLILGEGHGTYFSSSITGDIEVESKFSLSGGIEYSKDVELDFLGTSIVIPFTANLVRFYIEPGFFGSMSANISASVSQSRTYAFGMAYDYSSIGENVLNPSLSCRLASSSKEIEGSLEGRVAAGAYLELGFKLLSKELAYVCVRGEFGTQIKGDLVLRNSDIDASAKETKLYERLKASSIEMGPFVNASLHASVLIGDISTTLGENSSSLKKWDIVPTFTNTTFTRSSGSSSSAEASSQMSGDCLFPVTVGFKLFDDNDNAVSSYNSPERYTNEAGRLDYTFTGVSSDKSYTVYPKVNLFGFDILASPSAQLDREDPPACPDDAIDLGLPSGTKWCSHNVGASSPEDYGGYYAWGETSEKSMYDWENYAYYNSATGGCMNIGSDIAGTQYDVANVQMGAPWQMPTKEQMQELLDYCSWQWTQLNGVNGQLVTGPNGGQIFLPAAGYRWDDSQSNEGECGLYWSSSPKPNYYNDNFAFELCFSYTPWDNISSTYRINGYPVRPVCQ